MGRIERRRLFLERHARPPDCGDRPRGDDGCLGVGGPRADPSAYPGSRPAPRSRTGGTLRQVVDRMEQGTRERTQEPVQRFGHEPPAPREICRVSIWRRRYPMRLPSRRSTSRVARVHPSDESCPKQVGPRHPPLRIPPPTARSRSDISCGSHRSSRGPCVTAPGGTSQFERAETSSDHQKSGLDLVLHHRSAPGGVQVRGERHRVVARRQPLLCPNGLSRAGKGHAMPSIVTYTDQPLPTSRCPQQIISPS